MLRLWTPGDSCEAVIGGLADRVIARARAEGTPVLGHAVTSHPAAFRERLAAARASLGLRPDPRRPMAERRQDDEIAGCDAILADSAAVARGFAARGVPADRIAVVRPGFDPRRFHPRPAEAIDRACFRVVCIGLITPRKGQHVLLRAWRRLALPDAELLLVGTPGRDARTVLAERPEGITLTGHIDHAALGRLLHGAACLVLPSIEDGFGQAALEAMACGVPVILSDAVGAAELVRPGLSGLVVPALDVEALAAALECLHRDRDLGIAMGRAAATDVATLAGWPGYVAQVLALHRRLAARQPLAGIAEAAA